MEQNVLIYQPIAAAPHLSTDAAAPHLSIDAAAPHFSINGEIAAI